MPMYEYLCANCGKRFELIQKFSDAPLTIHEECGSGPVERLISAPALQFKGSGWYVNDYAKGSGTKPDSSSSPAPAAKTEGSTTAPAASTPAAPASGSSSSSSTSSESGSSKSDKSDK